MHTGWQRGRVLQGRRGAGLSPTLSPSSLCVRVCVAVFLTLSLCLSLCLQRAWGGSYSEAIPTFERAIELFRAETSTDCANFIEECNALLAFSQRNLDGTQASPMVIQTAPEDEARGGREGGGTGSTAGAQPQPAAAPSVGVAAPVVAGGTEGSAQVAGGTEGSAHVRAVDSAYLSVDDPDDVDDVDDID